MVSRDPEAAGSATRLRLRVDRVATGDEWIETSGTLVVTLKETAELVRERGKPYFRYGDRLLLEGKVEAPEPFSGFDYPAYLARQGVFSAITFPEATLLGEGEGSAFYRLLYNVRRDLADSLARVVPEPQASLGQALLLGIRENLPDDLTDDFRDTGTSHILAISGLHLGILLGISLTVSRWAFGRRRQIYLVLPFALIWLYALITGMSPSVTRAAIMGSVYLLALLVGRPRSVLPALGFAAALMVALNPNVLWSASFQLSFTALAGIAVLTEPVGRLLGKVIKRIPDEARPPVLIAAVDMAAMTIAATITTLPLVAFYFERISLVGIPTTALVLPALPFVLVGQALAGGLGLVSTTLAQPFGWLAWLPSAYVTGIAGLVARFPAASIETGQVASALVWTAYLALVLAIWRFTSLRIGRGWEGIKLGGAKRMAGSRPVVPWWAIAVIGAAAALLWIAALSKTDSRLTVSFIDVGQGDSVFITTPAGRQILVDGGPEPQGAIRYLGEKMPFGDRTIDMVVLTHAQEDHANGLVEVLRRYDVDRILEREVESDSPTNQEWRKAVAEEDAGVIQALAGQVIALDDGVFLQVLGPPERLLRGTSSDVDNASVVLKLVYGDVSFLLVGDIYAAAEGALVRAGAPLDSDVLKVAHHGSRTSSSPDFIDRVSPAVAVISAGSDNRFGHPHPETLASLSRYVPENRLFLTGERGTVELITDGKHLYSRTER